MSRGFPVSMTTTDQMMTFNDGAGAIAHDGHSAGHNNLDGVTNLTGSAGGIAFIDTHIGASA